MNRDRPVLGGGYHLPDNLAGILRDAAAYPLNYPFARYIGFLVLLLPLLGYALYNYAKNPLFLRRAFWLVPLFISAHLITGKIDEPRQMIPICFIVIPMAMFSFFDKTAISRPNPSLL